MTSRSTGSNTCGTRRRAAPKARDLGRALQALADAKQHGVRVASESALQTRYGPALGKGDAMWRGLAATLARPYVNLHFPERAGFRQPLAGERRRASCRSRSATASRSRI